MPASPLPARRPIRRPLWRLSLFLLLSAGALPAPAQVRLPAPELSVTDVVETQLAALQRGEDADLAVVFAFASPGNRAQTGPLPRFIAMIRDGYDVMIQHRSAELAPPLLDGDQAPAARAADRSRWP